jgi:hypothetical protein
MPGRHARRLTSRSIVVSWTAILTALGAVVGVNVGTTGMAGEEIPARGVAQEEQKRLAAQRQFLAQRKARERARSVPRRYGAGTRATAGKERYPLGRRYPGGKRPVGRPGGKKRTVGKERVAGPPRRPVTRKNTAPRVRKPVRPARRAAPRVRKVRPAKRFVPVGPSGAKTVARAMLPARGWGPAQFTCLNKLWIKESNWRVRAENPSSGAYGIPQALPASKLASAGSDWRTNPVTQVRWGLRYIDSRYGSPCAAWRFWRSHNWY